MSESNTNRTRPVFPKRVIITAGMPYGNKDLHFGHIGGVFVQADTFARFMRDRIGKDNVIFVSGTDCYGSPIVEYHRQAVAKGEYTGTLEEFVEYNHNRQKEVLKAYNIDLNLFAASCLGRATEIHRELGAEILQKLYENGHLAKMSTPQFYDAKVGAFLNGRQVLGRCPIQGCKSEKAYADECDLGHQFDPKDLIAPKSTLTGDRPEMRDVTNWYIKLQDFREVMKNWVDSLSEIPGYRSNSIKIMQEYFEPPKIYITREQIDLLNSMKSELPKHSTIDDGNRSIELVFDKLEERECACAILANHKIRYRTGKTLVPFRLTGNLEWGLPAPEIDGLKGVTFWVWPESLWAPISFSSTYLEQTGKGKDAWKEWWCKKDAKVIQFIGEDNVFFYGLAQTGIWLGMQGKNPVADPPEGQLQMSQLSTNCHILFFSKKASSSGDIKPPMAMDLLNYYTPDQLRAHFFSLGLGMRSVEFQPKPYNPKAGPKEGDPVLKEGFLLSNAFNRSVRSCFYTAQKFFNGKIPVGDISPDVKEQATKAILDYEDAMFRQEFNQVMTIAGDYIREINQRWSVKSKAYSDSQLDLVAGRQLLIDTFHMVRVATVLMHPVAPEGTEKIRSYLQLDEDFWSWDKIFDPVYSFMKDPEQHQLKFLEPRVDFFEKHPYQVQEFTEK